MTCRVIGTEGGGAAILCDGRSGGYRVAQRMCPWCCVRGDQPVRVLAVLIYGGYCGEDALCGTCGYSWSSDQARYSDVPQEERDENIARVASVPDPKCWECHDTGDCATPGLDEPEACKCGAAV